MRHSSLLALVVLLAFAAVAGAADRLHVSGPRTVTVGEHVRFPSHGFKPHERITVSLVPTLNRGGNCCGIEVISGARADANGEAILHFRWPRTYFNGPERVRWREGAKADVIVLAGKERGVRVVRVHRR
jgi:hypothetical protein